MLAKIIRVKAANRLLTKKQQRQRSRMKRNLPRLSRKFLARTRVPRRSRSNLMAARGISFIPARILPREAKGEAKKMNQAKPREKDQEKI